MARYRIEAENVALNSPRTKFKILTAEKARKYRDDIFETCTSLSNIYDRLYVIGYACLTCSRTIEK